MSKKTSKPSGVEPHELLQLNAGYAEALLAKEKFEHHLTRGHLLRALHDTHRLQNEVNQYKIAEQARVALQKQLDIEKEALADKQAKDKAIKDLAAEVHSRYRVGDQFAIDPVTGEFISLES